MVKPDDVVLCTLVAFGRHTCTRKSGGLLGLWRLAKAALVEYRRRDGRG